jgi:hypothetical protein
MSPRAANSSGARSGSASRRLRALAWAGFFAERLVLRTGYDEKIDERSRPTSNRVNGYFAASDSRPTRRAVPSPCPPSPPRLHQLAGTARDTTALTKVDLASEPR